MLLLMILSILSKIIDVEPRDFQGKLQRKLVKSLWTVEQY
jgi:hypothetical protein